jgi:hypothetical protein
VINDLITRLRHNTRSKLALEAADALEEAWEENGCLTTEGESARSIICDWYEMWECSNDPKHGLIERTEEYLTSQDHRR